MATLQGTLLAAAGAVQPHEIKMTFSVETVHTDSSKGYDAVTVHGRVLEFQVPPQMIHNRAAVVVGDGWFTMKGAVNLKGLPRMRERNPAVVAELGAAEFQKGYVEAFGDVEVRVGEAIRVRPTGRAKRTQPPKKGETVELRGIGTEQYAKLVTDNGKFVRFEGGSVLLYEDIRTLSSDAAIPVDMIPAEDTFPAEVTAIVDNIAAAAFRDLSPLVEGLKRGTFEEIFAQVTDPGVRSVLEESLGTWRAEVLDQLCQKWGSMFLDPVSGYICPVAVHVRPGGHWRLRAVSPFKESTGQKRGWPRLGLEFGPAPDATLAQAPVGVVIEAFDGHVDYFGIEEPDMWAALHAYITLSGLAVSAVGKVNLSDSSRYPGELRCYPTHIAFDWRGLVEKFGVCMPAEVVRARLDLFVQDAEAKNTAHDSAEPNAFGRRPRGAVEKLAAVARVWAQVYATTGVALLLPGMREKFDAAAKQDGGHYVMLPAINTDMLYTRMPRIWGTKSNRDALIERALAYMADLAARSRADTAAMWEGGELQLDTDGLTFLNDKPAKFTEKRFAAARQGAEPDAATSWTLMAYVGAAPQLRPEAVAAAAVTWRGEPARVYVKNTGKRGREE